MSIRFLTQRNGTDGCVRYILFRDTENQGSSPSLANILHYTTAGSSTLVSPYFWFNHNPNAEKNRIVILYDVVVCVSSNDPNVTFDLELTPSQLRHARFRDNTSTVSGAAEGAMFMLVITDQAANQPISSYISRISFTDD